MQASANANVKLQEFLMFLSFLVIFYLLTEKKIIENEDYFMLAPALASNTF
jgi:hypothetical protein